jgi:RimJ/RimL family protein N-acetyltransferase
MTDQLVDGDLTLRRAVPADAPDVVEVYSEPDTRHWMLWDRDLPDLDEALANIERSEKAWADGWGGVFRVVVDGHVVGGVNLHFVETAVGELSYFLRASARGRGLATRAVLLAADWGFREHGLMRVFLRADPANAGSTALAERAGFSYEGTERESAVYPDSGRRFDSRVYSLLPHERVTLRPATEADADFLIDAAMTATEDQGRFPADLDRAEYRAGFREWTLEQVRGEVPDSTTSVVAAYGVDVGRLRVVRTDGLVELAGLQLLPAHQGRGLGTRVIRDLMAEAAASGRGFGLSVEKDNSRARALYERLGLVVVGEDGDEHMMRLVPNATQEAPIGGVWDQTPPAGGAD